MNRIIAIFMLLFLALAPREVADGFPGAVDGVTPEGVYNVVARDQDGQPVPGVAVTFCDVTCKRYVTDAQGVIRFTGEPVRYNLQISGVPEGYSYDAAFDAVCDGSGEWVVVPVVRE